MKYRLKHSLRSTLFVIFISIFVTSPIPIADAATDVWPDEIVLSGKTGEVMVNGVNNSGIIDFDALPASLSSYKARLVRIGNPPFANGEVAYEMRGWGWNDNLGWVSFYCDGVQNLEGACSYTYKVELIKKTDASGNIYFSFKGYAWNDATGRISMNSSNDVPAPPVADSYGVRMDQFGTFVSDYPEIRIIPFVKTPSIGWMNFSGVQANFEVLTILGCEDKEYVGVCPKICDSDKTNCDSEIKSATVGDYPVADGVDKYTITLNFKDPDGNPISKTELINNYDFRVFLEWTDTVKQNQLESGSQAGENLMYLKAPISTIGSIGAIYYKPVFLYNTTASSEGFKLVARAPGTIDTNNADVINVNGISGKADWDGDSLVLSVKSLAPTSGGNRSKVVSITSKNVYKDNDPGINGEKNELKLSSIYWIMKEKSTNREKKGTIPCGDLALNFRPALTVDKLNTYVKPQGTSQAAITAAETDPANDTVVLYRNIPSIITTMAKSAVTGGTMVKPIDPNGNSKIEFRLQNNASGQFNINTKIEENGELKPYDFSTPYIQTFDRWMGVRKAQLMPTITNDATTEYTKSISLKSIIYYTATVGLKSYPISYYSNFLPRTEAAISNPVAIIQGTLYGTAASPRSDVNISGIGDNNTNIVKDTVYENIKKAIRDKNIGGPTDGSAVTVTSNGQDFSCNPTTACTTLDLNSTEKMIYITAREVTLTGTGVISWTGNKVLVINGGNLFLDKNIYTTDESANKLGIVIIRNTNDKLGKAGNIYIGPDVTDIQAFIVAWGAVFSYDGVNKTNIDLENGEFGWADENEMVKTLKNQLVLKGGISSNNTIGGTDKNKSYYLTGYGILPANNSDNLIKAKKYDLNYLRFFKQTVKYDPETGNPWDTSCGKYLTPEELDLTSDTNTANDPVNTANGKKCDGIDPSVDLMSDSSAVKANSSGENENAPVYIKYVPPYSKSQIFGTEKRLTF